MCTQTHMEYHQYQHTQNAWTSFLLSIPRPFPSLPPNVLPLQPPSPTTPPPPPPPLDDLCGWDLQFVVDAAAEVLVQQRTQLVVLVLQRLHVAKAARALLHRQASRGL